MKGKSTALFALAVALIAFLTYVVVQGLPWFQGKYIRSAKNAIVYGLDLKGGVTITYAPEGNVKPTQAQLDTVKSIMESRLGAKNYYDANVATSATTGRVIVEIPNLTDPEAAVKEFGKTALLEYIDPQDQPYQIGQPLLGGQTILSGTDIKSARASAAQTGWQISFEITPDAQKRFAAATERLAPGNKPIVIALDRVVISAPSVHQRIDSPTAQITGTFTEQEARGLADLIQSGALPFKLKAVDYRYIGATLGKNALDISIKAGLIGLLLVALFMMIWYRVPGVAAALALLGYTATVLFLIARLEITLTLPGIAGVILSIGVAVDANVIIFERIKEELKTGKSLRAAIDAGFHRAMPPIIDANITTLISAIILGILGTGPIRGFAWVLGIGVVVSMLSAILLTRFLVNRLYEMGVTNPKLFGFKGETA